MHKFWQIHMETDENSPRPYGLPEKCIRTGKNTHPYRVLLIFNSIHILGKCTVIYACTNAIWSTVQLMNKDINFFITHSNLEAFKIISNLF